METVPVPEPKPVIELKELCLEIDDDLIVDHINLKIYENEFITLLGPSGCGKSTTLRMIAGLSEPTSGYVIIDGKIFNDIPPYARPLNTVFQKYALFPNMNVIENVVCGLKSRPYKNICEFFGGENALKEELISKNIKPGFFTIRKLIKQKIYEAGSDSLKLVKLNGYENRKISEMSGGQQQRVAIARAIVNKPRILLLDEPLSALDLKLRENMQYELKEIQKRLGITFIFVTHDQTEAMTMSSRIVVLKDGKIQQVGTPKDIYNHPVNEFVAKFVGETNMFKGNYRNIDGISYCFYNNHNIPCRPYTKYENEEIVDVVIRPENLRIVSKEEGFCEGTVTTCVFKGTFYEICAMVNGKEFVINSDVEVKPSTLIYLTAPKEKIHLMKVIQSEEEK